MEDESNELREIVEDFKGDEYEENLDEGEEDFEDEVASADE